MKKINKRYTDRIYTIEWNENQINLDRERKKQEYGNNIIPTIVGNIHIHMYVCRDMLHYKKIITKKYFYYFTPVEHKINLAERRENIRK